jgi:hypothetical protein
MHLKGEALHFTPLTKDCLQTRKFSVGFEVLTALSKKMAVFWAPMMEPISTSEMPIYFYQTTTQKTAIFTEMFVSGTACPG